MRVFYLLQIQFTRVVAILTLAALTTPIGITEAANDHAKESVKPPLVEVAFVLDTTSSMSGLIATAKEKIWAIANTLASAEPSPTIRMGLVGYRDRGDAYVTTVTPLSEDLDAVYTHLMQFQAVGGGDGPESVNQALYESVTRMAWSNKAQQAYRVIFLVGDAPPHMDYQNDILYTKSCSLASKKGIIINTIQCGTVQQTTPVWKHIARLAEGTFFHVSQSGNAVMYKSPYDKKIAMLSRAVDETRVYYGDASLRKEMEARTKQADKIHDAAAPSAVTQRAIFNAKKSGAKNFLGSQELVQAVEEGKVNLGKIEKENLPIKLRDMKPVELNNHIQARIQKRKKLQAEITQLSKKRQLYIEQKVRRQKDGGAQSLDAKIFHCVRTQAAKANIAYIGGPVY